MRLVMPIAFAALGVMAVSGASVADLRACADALPVEVPRNT